MKYKIRILSIAMATIVLLAMGATLSVSAAPTVGSAAPIVGAPSVCITPTGPTGLQTRWLFAQSAQDNHLYVSTLTIAGGVTTQTPWKSLGGTLTAAPAAVYRGTDIATGGTVISVYVRGTDGLYVDTTLNAQAATPVWHWYKIYMPVGMAAGIGPGAVAIPTAAGVNQDTYVFVVTTQGNNMWVMHFDATQIPPITTTNVGGIVTATPGAVVTSMGNIAVFVRGTDAALYEKIGISTAWGGYSKFNRGLLLAGTGPTAVFADGQITLLVTGTNLHVYEIFTSVADGGAGVTWNNILVFAHNVHLWVDLGITMTSSPSATVWPPTAASPDVFVVSRGGNGDVWSFQNTGAVPPTTAAQWGTLTDLGSP